MLMLTTFWDVIQISLRLVLPLFTTSEKRKLNYLINKRVDLNEKCMKSNLVLNRNYCMPYIIYCMSYICMILLGIAL